MEFLDNMWNLMTLYINKNRLPATGSGLVKDFNPNTGSLISIETWIHKL